MPNVLKPSGAKGIGSNKNRFDRAHVRLTLLYVGILAATLFLSSAITYSAFSQKVNSRFNRMARPPIIELPDGTFLVPTPRDVRDDLIWSLILVNSVLLTIGGVFSYWFAGITLEPIEAAYDRQRRFLSDASHELRTPLSILQTTMENQITAGHEKTKDQLEEVERMGRLVSDLLTLSRLDEERPLQKIAIPITAVLREAIGQLCVFAEQSRVHTKESFDADTKSLTVFADHELLLRALTNIIKNAIVYNRENGLVTIIAKKEKEDIRITVQDTGIGIAPDEREKIFDRFYRGDTSRSRATGGSGLGLSIVKSIIRGMNGSITIKSIVGEGTEVSVILPIHKAS